MTAATKASAPPASVEHTGLPPQRTGTRGPTAWIQRACSCGAAAGISGECPNCATEKRLGLQAKLRITPPGDHWEREADRVADQVVSERPRALERPLSVTPLVQRQVVDEEGNDAEEIQAQSTASLRMPQKVQKAAAASEAVAALNSGARPLSAAERTYFEPRFGRDLSAVRLHDDARAGAAAQAIGARAYTLGSRIAFAPNQYNPENTEGRRLIAHELTHTIQQGGNPIHASIQRRTFFEEIGGLFRGDNFDSEELRNYLDHIVDTNQIEDFTDSDNKARALVDRLRNGDNLFGHGDSGALRALLIREMQSGFTGNDDERAILFLLKTADEVQLREMFTIGELSVESLDSDFHGAEQRELSNFFEQRFEGGRTALESGQVSPRPQRTPFERMTVEMARRRLEVAEGLLADSMAIELDRNRSLQERRILDRTASDPGTVMGLREREELAATERMNREPLEVMVMPNRIVFRVRFHIRFEDPSMENRSDELTESLRTGIAQVWDQRISGGTFGGRELVMQPEIAVVAHDAPRDSRFWLLTVRPTDLDPVTYPGCTFDETVEGVPTSVTEIDCDGGLISIPPSHIARPGIIGHETLHLFGLIDRYLSITDRSSETGPVTGHRNAPDRETPGRPDPLGTEEGTILEEDLAFVLETQGAYEQEIRRHTGGRSIAALRAEAERLREIIRLGRNPRSLIRPRENFNRELFRSADDI